MIRLSLGASSPASSSNLESISLASMLKVITFLSTEAVAPLLTQKSYTSANKLAGSPVVKNPFSDLGASFTSLVRLYTLLEKEAFKDSSH